MLDKDQGIASLLSDVSEENIKRHLFYLSKDPLPCRRINCTIPGHETCTLYEADDYIAACLEKYGYIVEREGAQARPYRRDETREKHAQHGQPWAEDPWYTLYNIHAVREGRELADDVLVMIAHKDSQSWVDSPGAYDNAAGTASLLEIARVLGNRAMRHALHVVFCNEEHAPWTSITAAATIHRRYRHVLAVINQDSPGRKRPEDTDLVTCTTYYTTPEGKRLAEFMGHINRTYELGIAHDVFEHDGPRNDDGSFIKEGIPVAVHNGPIHSYRNPYYHTEEDKPERIDLNNVTQIARLSLAAVLELDKT